MKYKDLLKYIIAFLYKTKKKSPSIYISIEDIVNKLDYPASISDLKDIVDYLEAAGYVQSTDIFGAIPVSLTTKGMIYYEDFEESYIKKIEEFFKNKGINRYLGKLVQISNPEEKAKKDLVKAIDKLIKLFSKKESIDNDLLSDLEILKIEISKRSPEREILNMKLDNLIESNIETEKIRSIYSLIQ